MEGQICPDQIDEPNLQYKFHRKLKVFNGGSFPNRGYNLVTISNKYGLVFIGSPEGNLLVYYLKYLTDVSYEAPLYLNVLLQETPTHMSVSCDEELLAVIGSNILYIFKANSFQNHPASPIASIPCDAGAVVSSLQWNPCIPDIIAIAFFNGVLLVANVSTKQMHKIQAKARCVCWSPKGKQIVVGNNDGTLCQYKPDLSPMKLVQAPKLFDGAPIETVAIHWISTYQFAVVYRDASRSCRPVVTIVNTPKGGSPSFLNYDDICYSQLSVNRPCYYYLLGFAPWNIIMTSSSNGAEIGTLGSVDGVNWVQWRQTEEAIPMIPMYPKSVENYPIGLSLSTCAIHNLVWGEDTELPYMPTLLVLTHTGLLFLFNVVNLNNNAPKVCTPPLHLILPTSHMIQTAVEAPKTPVADPIPPAAPVTQPVEVPKQALPDFSQFTPPLPASTPKPSGFEIAFGAVTAKAPPASTFYTAPPASTVYTAPPAPTFEPPVQATFTKPSAPSQVQPTPVPPKQVTVTIADALPQPAAVTSQDLTANLKEDQKRAQIEANKEFTNMLVKEVNEFQVELYNFMNKAQAIQMQAFYDLSALQCNGDLHDMDAKKLKTDCSLEELRESIIQTKLELIRACAVVAEARSQPFAKDLQEWSSPDPLSSKHLTSIKKLVYYIQTQIDQAQDALDHKWNQLAQERQFDDKLGPRMIRPVLDDVYRPLVKQQEILTRQQAVLKTLRTTIMQYDIMPTYNSSSLLRDTSLKEESLSKLTKNILNIKLESTKSKNIPGLSVRKVEALRDMLSEHKTVIIKPVDVELREHFSTLRLKHEKALKEKVAKENLIANIPLPTADAEKAARQTVVQNTVQAHPEVKPVKPATSFPDYHVKPENKVSADFSKPEMKPEFIKPMAPSKSVVTPAVTNVVRTLFTDDAPQKVQPVSAFVPSTKPSVASNSVLKDILQNKTNTVDVESKNELNTFMGQKICSPTASITSSFSKGIFATKPFQSAAGSVNIFATNKSAQVLPSSTNNAKSDETGEAELLPKEAQEILSKNAGLTIIKTVKSDKPLFAAKAPVPPLIVPDVLKNAQTPSFTFTKVEPKISENVFQVKAQETDSIKIVKPTSVPTKQKEKEATPIDKTATSEPTATKPTYFSTSTTFTSPVTTEANISTTAAEVKASPAALFSAANAASSGSKSPQSIFATASSPLSPKGSIFGSPTKSTFTGSIFGNKTEVTEKSETSPTTPISVTTASSPVPITTPSTTVPASQAPSSSTVTSVAENKSIFGVTVTSPKSIFGTAAVAASTQSASVFGSSPTQASPVFSSAAPTTTTSIFGSPPAVSQPSSLSSPINLSTPSSVFASNSSATKPSIFGSPPTNTQTPFVTPETSTQTPVFGTAPITQTSVFGGATTITSAFGSTSPTTQSSIFGTPAATNQASIFGTPKTTQASIFGTTTPTTQASIFGTASPASNQNASPFGGAESNLFAAASISTTSAQPTTPGNIFGASNASTGSVFGGDNVFGAKPAFGQPQASNIFGGSSQFGQQQQQNQNSFWNGASNTTGFGGQSQQSSIFGGSGGSFSQPAAQNQGFGSPSGQTSVFGTPQQQQQPATAFGGSPGFGSKPAFGQSSAFGGTPTGFGSFNNSPTSAFGGSASFCAPASFGSGSAFGNTSPGKMFSGGSPGFVQSTQSNAMFESLATQNTVSFGNLAQQSPQAPAPAPSFNTSPSFTGWRS